MEASGVSMMSRPDRRSPFYPDVADSAVAERHYRHPASAYHHNEPLPPHSSMVHHGRQSRLFVEEMPLRPVCLCHSCNVARMESRSKAYTGYTTAEAESWSATLQEQYYRRDYMTPKSYVDGRSSPHSFSIHTPLGRDAEMVHNLSSPPSVSRVPKCSPQSSGFATPPPFFPKYPFTENQINICKWFPIRLPDAENPAAIALGGYRVSHTSDFVKTGTIVERIRKNALRTSDGVEVVLAGPLDMRMTIMNGFSDTVADIFYSGFPNAWKSVLSDDAQLANMKANITSLARPRMDRVPEASPEARAEPQSTDPAEKDTGKQRARAAEEGRAPEEAGVASPLRDGQVSCPSTPIAAKPAAEEGGSAASEPPVERAPSNRTATSEPVAEPGVVEEAVLGDDAFLSAAEEGAPVAEEGAALAEEDVAVAAEASEDAEHESVREDMDAIETQAAEEARMEVDGDPCPVVVDDPPEEQSRRPANSRKRSRSRVRARYGMKRKGRGKKSKNSTKEVDEATDKTNEPADQSDDQRQPTSLADQSDEQNCANEQDQSEERHHPTSVADKADEQQPETGEDERRGEHVPAKQRKKATQRTKRSPLPPPLPTPRVTKDEVIEAYGLKTSRSGRLLVPPLAYWRNQTVARDKDGGIIAILEGFEEGPADTGYFNFKPPRQKKAVKLQEKLCAAASESPLTSKVTGKGRPARRRSVR